MLLNRLIRQIYSICIWMIGFLFCVIPLSAQENTANFDHITVEQGLSQSEVYAILKDKQGFMWFGTVDGLNKYNGYNFIHYKHDPYDSTTLSHNHVNALHEDKSGNLWVGTLFGLNKFDKHTNTFTRYPRLLKSE